MKNTGRYRRQMIMMPRFSLGIVLVVLLAATTSTVAFHPPTNLARVEVNSRARGRTNEPRVGVVVSLSKDDEDSGESRIPFFARAMQKLRPKKEEEEEGTLENTNEEENTVNKVQVEVEKDVKVDEVQVEKVAVKEDSEADLLRATAEKVRLEAEKMELSLTLTKIEKLEAKLKLPVKTDRDDRSDILSEIEILTRKMNPPQVVKSSVTLAANEKISGETQPTEGSLSSSDSKEKGEKNIVQEIMDGEKPLLGEAQREDAISSFAKLPEQIKNMMAKTVGMENGSNATAVVEKLMEENRLFEGSDSEKFSMIAKAEDVEDIFIDMDFEEINTFVKSLLPEVTRKEPTREEYVDAVYAEVLGKDTFNVQERKPQAVPGGYLIRGISKVRPQEGRDDGDVLVEALDKRIAKSSVAGKIQAYYILDPTPPSGEEILNDEDETPVLLITNYDISPDTDFWVKPFVTFLGLASIAAFSLGSFSFNESVLSRVDNVSGGDGSYDFLYDLSLPLAMSVLATQLAHEAGHLIIAIKDGIDIGIPTITPSFQFGITGGITPIKSSPKNIKSLFDFAIAGPLLGLGVSVALLYYGLELTAFMDDAAREQLPSMSVELLRSSALGGGIIDYLLGDGVLNSPGQASTELIKLHPYAIAGFAGLMTNALSLLPLGNTDGGRISVAFFGRSFSRIVNGTALLGLVIAGIFGADEASVLLCYAVFCQFWQNEAEIPCRNEVDELDSTRGFIAIAMSVIVLLTLIPLPQ